MNQHALRRISTSHYSYLVCICGNWSSGCYHDKYQTQTLRDVIAHFKLHENDRYVEFGNSGL